MCAPTSSGKTFISYYTMEKVMRDASYKDGILVFVAPTKSLINQIAAQVYGSFHSSFGIFTGEGLVPVRICRCVCVCITHTRARAHTHTHTHTHSRTHTHTHTHTDAYRHRALTCRILVTVPECLESLLLSPENAAWAQRIRCINYFNLSPY